MRNVKPRPARRGAGSATEKEPFDIGEAVRRLREAVRPYPKAALFELAAEGHDTVFEILTACIISIRTRDETTLPTSRRLFARAATPAEAAKLTAKEIDALISDCTHHEMKAYRIRDIARRAVAEFGGDIPCEQDELLSFKDVGPKCANLVMGIVCEKPSIGVAFTDNPCH